MKNHIINLKSLSDDYKLSDEQFETLHGGSGTTCSCGSCGCTCIVEPSAEMATTNNTESGNSANNTLDGNKSWL